MGSVEGQKVLYALVNKNTEVGMSGKQLGDFMSRENVWKLTYSGGHRSRDWTRGLTPEQNNENLKFSLQIQAPGSHELHAPPLSPRKMGGAS